MITIKRYKNRKLYLDGQYINLAHVTSILKGGGMIQVIDYETGQDVTEQVLKDCINFVDVEIEKLINLFTSSH